MICFGMPTLIENETLEDNARLCQRLGLKFLELNMNFPEYQINQLERTEELRQLADEYGIFYTIHLDENLDPAAFNPLVRKAWMETARKTAEVALKLEAPVVNMHLCHGIYVTLPDRKVRMYDRDRSVYLSHVREFRKEMETVLSGTGTKICLENTDGFLSFERAAVEEMLQSSVFGLTWDIGHSKATGEKDVPFLMGKKERLCHFHIHDGKEEPPKNHLALGDGDIDLRARLTLAKECTARCVLETKTVKALEASVLWLKERKYLPII